MSGYTIAELEALYGYSKNFGAKNMLGGGANPTLYDSMKYRFALLAYVEAVLGVTGYRDPDTNWGSVSDPILLVDPSRIRTNAWGKADCVAYLEKVTPAIIKVAIDNYTSKSALATLIAAFQALGLNTDVATQLASSVIYLWAMVPGDLGGQVLANPHDFAANWSRTNDFAISGGALVYTHSAGSGTATQLKASFLVTEALDKWYKFDYMVSSASGASRACTITTAFAAVAQSLDLTNGRHTVNFKSNASSITGFVLSGTSSGAAGFTIDDVELNEIQSNADTEVARTLEVGATALAGYPPRSDQWIAQLAIAAVYALREGEIAYYNGNPIQ